MKKFLFICFIFFLTALSAQSRRRLEAKRKRLSKDIKKIERILSQTRKEKADALEELKDYNDKVEIREKLIETIELETEEITKEIEQNKFTIEKNEKELKILKADYAKMIYKSQNSKFKQSQALFLMSSKDFNQAYKRLKYINDYKVFKRNQATSIVEKTKLIKSLTDSLIVTKEKNLELLKEKQLETEEISKEKKEREKIVSKIKRQESKYRSRLNKKLKEEQRISDKINEIISRAIRKANKRKKSKSNKLVLTAEETALKERFEHNKGKLPAPIKSGYVTRKFGIQSHPQFKRIKIKSTGIHIRCKKGDDALAIFNGKVLVVQLLSKGRKSVFIQHGNYITAYTNLERVYVKKGSIVKTGQRIGEIFTDKVNGQTTLQFVLSRNTKPLDPLKWIKL